MSPLIFDAQVKMATWVTSRSMRQVLSPRQVMNSLHKKVMMKPTPQRKGKNLVHSLTPPRHGKSGEPSGTTLLKRGPQKDPH